MGNIYLSKSSYCKCVQCKKILWLKKYRPEYVVQTAKDSVLENGSRVGELAKGLFGEYQDIEFNENLNIMIEKTQQVLKNKPNIITEASFNYENNFCSVDILKNDIEGVEIYEVKSSTEVHDIYIDDASYQCYVLSNLGLNVKRVCIVYINNQYIREDELEIGKLFNIEDITDIAKSKQEEIRNNIASLNKFMEEHDENNEPNTDIGMHCFEPYDCEFWEYCTKNLPKPNVFDIAGGMRKDKKFEKYYEGKISFEEENILSGSGDFVEIHGRDLVAKYVGWTAKKVHDTVEQAIGGVLFIDEAYSLISNVRGSFEDEAIATLIKEMEDHRNEICIILAGYTEEMKNLIELNPGFESRIQFTINFPDYSEEELLEIFNGLCKKEKYKLSENCKETLIRNFNIAKTEKNFGNGRYVRNLFEKVKFEQADRIIQSNSKAINSIINKDIESAINAISHNEKERRKIGFCC